MTSAIGKAVVLSVLIPFICSCSVVMAMKGTKTADLGVVRMGTDRGVVELQLGTAVQTVVHDDNSRTLVYEYEIGNDPSAGRAAVHGLLDIATLGGWELIGTPVEAFQGDKYRISITYDADDKVIKVGRNTEISSSL